MPLDPQLLQTLSNFDLDQLTGNSGRLLTGEEAREYESLKIKPAWITVTAPGKAIYPALFKICRAVETKGVYPTFMDLRGDVYNFLLSSDDRIIRPQGS